ncbi:CheY-like chemotaxis protein [Chitinophaga polysaccharea]|uniref:CheY-like chemotaxis protein n=1 Tax=Chitinophaga polysaccharea TaxID=1293035 RepID=A0A561Q3E9_9BACT|nr:response regulator [Chitinophaga polysaccharea]TWF44880.1 CheY-like chemotaxis protein [Chitinophaga polysaccharea]
MKIKVLHAEDDLVFSRIVRRILPPSDFEVYHACDGEQAWELFTKMNFHYCLLDIMMPRLGGIDLGERIRNTDKEVPICYLSAEELVLVEQEVFGRGGGTAFFNKTFNINKLSLFLKQYFITNPIR